MLKLLLVSNRGESLSEFSAALNEYDDVEIFSAESEETALKIVKENSMDLVVTDEEIGDISGLEFAKILITTHPMVNCVAVSSLPEKEFHEASEGLGLMTRLPVRPGRKEAGELLKNLLHIKGLEFS